MRLWLDAVKAREPDSFVLLLEPGLLSLRCSFVNYLISLGGVVQRPGIDYVINSANNGTIEFTTPPPPSVSAGVYFFKFSNYNSNLNIVNIITKTTPMTATGDFISLVINGNQKYIRLWEG